MYFILFVCAFCLLLKGHDALLRTGMRAVRNTGLNSIQIMSETEMRRSQAFISVSSKVEQCVGMRKDPGMSLTKYMQLPVDQYVCVKIPLSATLERIEGNEFLLTVPEVRFFAISVIPYVTAYVSQTQDSVVIESAKVVLKGSPQVERLNGCYDIHVRTEFRWVDNLESGGRPKITSSSKIKVGVNPPSPFKHLPRVVLENTGNLAMKLALDQIEGAFLKALGADYDRWANDAEYRLMRAQSDMCNLEMVGVEYD